MLSLERMWSAFFLKTLDIPDWHTATLLNYPVHKLQNLPGFSKFSNDSATQTEHRISFFGPLKKVSFSLGSQWTRACLLRLRNARENFLKANRVYASTRLLVRDIMPWTPAQSRGWPDLSMAFSGFSIIWLSQPPSPPHPPAPASHFSPSNSSALIVWQHLQNVPRLEEIFITAHLWFAIGR